jgi:LysM repeat protein
MPWSQKVAPNLQAQDYAGYCLRFQQKVFPGSPVTYYPTARAAWDASGFKHAEYPDGSAAVPLSYSWVGSISGITQDWGHAAVFIPGYGVLSSPGSGYGQKLFGSIDECGSYFGATYLGWTEDVGGFRVVDYVEAPAPSPEPAPTPVQTTYTVVPGDNLWNISTAFYGTGTRYPEIASANGIENPNLIFPGQVLVIPGV